MINSKLMGFLIFELNFFLHFPTNTRQGFNRGRCLI